MSHLVRRVVQEGTLLTSAVPTGPSLIVAIGSVRRHRDGHFDFADPRDPEHQSPDHPFHFIDMLAGFERHLIHERQGVFYLQFEKPLLDDPAMVSLLAQRPGSNSSPWMAPIENSLLASIVLVHEDIDTRIHAIRVSTFDREGQFQDADFDISVIGNQAITWVEANSEQAEARVRRRP